MANDYFNFAVGSRLVRDTTARSADVNALIDSIEAGFNVLPTTADIHEGKVTYCGDDTGTVNTYLVTMPSTITSYTDGLSVEFKPLSTNTGAATLNVSSVGVKPLLRADGSAVAAGDIIANSILSLRYSDNIITNGAFIIQHSLPSIATAAAASAASAAADVVLSHADVVLTHADVVLTHADVVLTHADVGLTHADVVLTGLDVITTNANVVTTNNNASTTNTNVGLTNADVVLTHADVLLTHADVISTAADALATGLDAAATAADVILTNADVITIAGIYDAFDDRYLGAKATDPNLDNDGNALLTGALYWNTTTPQMRVYSGAAWETAYLPASGYAVLTTNTFTGGQNEARGSVAMHATTMDLWAQPNIIDGTSSAVTVTTIANAPQAGSRRVLYPVANSIITNGATFAVDGAANHTAAAGDKWEFEAITTSTYKVHVTKKDGTAVVGGSSGISNVTTATTSTTLTSTPTLLKFTPTTYGEPIILPDATTCPKGGPLHILDLSDSAYPAKVIDGSGAVVGFIFPGVVSSVSLSDNSTAAGTWAISNVELAGASALLATTNILTIESVIEIDSDREFILGKGASDYSYGVVYNRTTNAFGAVTAIRSAATTGKHAAIKSATDRVLVVSCNGTTGFEAVVCSLSGTTITPNTAATATLSANISTFADGCGLIQVGTSWITSYTVATPAAQIREITISGTTPTISAATVLDGTGGGLIIAGDATHVIAVSTATSHLYTKPYTIGGLSAGTGTDTVSGTQVLSNLTALGTRFFVAHYDGAALYGSVISLSGTTTTISTATAFSTNGIADAIVVGSNKVLMLSSATSNNANIITDTAGTASAGTAITLSAQNQRACVYVSGTDVAVGDGNSIYSIMILSCSGTSPVLSKIIAQTNLDSAEQGKFYPSNKMMNRSPNAVYSGTYARTINDEATTANFGIQINGGTFKKVFPGRLSYEAAIEYRGKNDSERWLADVSSQIVKIECAA